MPTNIQWTDETWNCVRGCSRVSAGCGDSTGGGCYAERQAYRFSGPGMPYEGLVRMTPKGPRWTGKVVLVEEKLQDPLRWKKPRRIFVNSMSDLFHESLSDHDIARVFATMWAADHHVYQVLTKRPERMQAWTTRYEAGLKAAGRRPLSEWRHVWLGTSVEDQKTADERIPLLLQTPAAVRWISYEPALGPVDLSLWIGTYDCVGCGYRGFDAKSVTKAEAVDGDEKCPSCGAVLEFGMAENSPNLTSLDWAVVGGESGPRARPFDLTWARSIMSQCSAASVPVFMKQLGARPQDGEWTLRGHDHPTEPYFLRLADKKGGDINEWPNDLRVREFPQAA